MQAEIIGSAAASHHARVGPHGRVGRGHLPCQGWRSAVDLPINLSINCGS